METAVLVLLAITGAMFVGWRCLDRRKRPPTKPRVNSWAGSGCSYIRQFSDEVERAVAALSDDSDRDFKVRYDPEMGYVELYDQYNTVVAHVWAEGEYGSADRVFVHLVTLPDSALEQFRKRLPLKVYGIRELPARMLLKAVLCQV